MEPLGFLAIVIVIGVPWLVLWVILRIARAVFSGGPSSPASTVEMTADEEGYAHSGPHGYSAGTAYPETQYGSGFDPDADWNEHEER